MSDTSEARWHEWDYTIAPSLRQIADDSTRIMHLAETICDRCERLKYRPTFKTIAENELGKALRSVEEAAPRARADIAL